MPKENKKRGRRMQDASNKKRKIDAEPDDTAAAASSSTKKRQENLTFTLDGTTPPPPEATRHAAEEEGDGDEAVGPAGHERAFFGVLDEQEQEYFRHADDLLEANDFPEPSERQLFLANVYREADGKELKLAQSQSCSRLMERLILLSSPEQMKRLFVRFSGNFIHLITHRFASHCCEALFQRAAPVVTDELTTPNKTQKDADSGEKDGRDENMETEVAMENHYLDTMAELEGSIGYLLTDRYASHVLRVLLLVLSGEPIDTPQAKRLLQSKKKESNSVQQRVKEEDVPTLNRTRSVPKSFSEALQQLIAESIAGLDTEKLRLLATHPNGNPTLQLLLKLELTHFGKQRAKDETSVIRTLLPDDPITADSGSASFINGLVYDPIGSHLMERIIEHAPGKMFKTLYLEFFKERLPAYARNEVASYVACRILDRLGHDDLLEAHELLIPHITPLLQKDRTIVVRTLIERCTIRDIDTKAIAAAVDNTWHNEESDNFEVVKLVKYNPITTSTDATLGHSSQQHDSKQASNASETAFTRNTESIKTHFNLLAQAMLLVPGSLSALVLDSLSVLDQRVLLDMSRDPIISRTLQAALTTKNSSMITTRRLIQHFYGRIGEMAVETAASHVVDCIWEGTHGLAFIRERIAEELAENESALRESPCGRAVWKNWKMDLYKRRRGDWITQSRVKASNDGFQSFAEIDENKEGGAGAAGEKKTPLQAARERHMKKKRARESNAAGEGGPAGGERRRSLRTGKGRGESAATGANA